MLLLVELDISFDDKSYFFFQVFLYKQKSHKWTVKLSITHNTDSKTESITEFFMTDEKFYMAYLNQHIHLGC